MTWLERLFRRHSKHTPLVTPSATTTIILHRNDTNIPLIHNLQGLWQDEALSGVLEALVQEYYEPGVLGEVCEILWRQGNKTWGEEIGLVVNVSPPGGGSAGGCL